MVEVVVVGVVAVVLIVLVVHSFSSSISIRLISQLIQNASV